MTLQPVLAKLLKEKKVEVFCLARMLNLSFQRR